MMDIRATACILLTVASVGAASAHHGWGYDATKVFTINGPVETLTWADRQAVITLKYEGSVWEATLAPRFRMRVRGLTREMLKPGTVVAVEGYPSTTQKQHEMRAERITVAGKSVELR